LRRTRRGSPRILRRVRDVALAACSLYGGRADFGASCGLDASWAGLAKGACWARRFQPSTSAQPNSSQLVCLANSSCLPACGRQPRSSGYPLTQEVPTRPGGPTNPAPSAGTAATAGVDAPLQVYTRVSAKPPSVFATSCCLHQQDDQDSGRWRISAATRTEVAGQVPTPGYYSTVQS
jgi:hypothetical protein